jgi:DNA-binding winged helix-turn-helix (wHTH) protein/tetratricopeptide (TPR) repeat protein
MTSRLVTELRRRHVFRAGALYLLVAWGVLQLADIVVPALGLPDWVITLVLVLLLLCFPLALVLAWIFDVTPHGLRRTEEEPQMKPPTGTETGDEGPAPLSFGEFELDLPRRELRRNDVAVELQPRVFSLLAYLAENRHRAVSKDELQHEVWSHTVVTEASLTRAVMKLRQAVGDDAGNQSIIKTVHGHGYRFIAKVGAPELAHNAPAATDASRRLTGVWVPLSIGGVLIAAVAAGIFSLMPRDVVGTRIAVLPVTDSTNEEELAWARLGLMSFASDLIEASEGLSVVSDSHILSLSEDLGDNDALIAERLRRGFGTTHVLKMELTQSGGGLRLTYSLTGPESNEVRGTMVDEDATVLVRGVARSVVAAIAGQRRMRDQFKALSDDPFLNEAYARGMSLVLEGRCADARGLFKVVMDQEPSSFDARYEYAYCSRLLGEPDLAEGLLVELVEEQRQNSPNRSLARALQTLGVLYNRTGRLDEAERTEMEALTIARTIGDQDLAGGLLINLSIIAEDRGDFDLAKERLGRAMVAYRDAGREVLPGHIYAALANLAMDHGELNEAEKNLELALESFRFVGDRRNEAMMLNNTGYLLRLQGRLEEAESFHQESYALREEIGDRVGMGRVRNLMAQLYLARGHFDDALQAATEAASIASASKDRLYEATARMHMGYAELGRNDLDAAESHFMNAREIFAAIQDRMRTLSADVELARIDYERGDMTAEGTVRQLLERAQHEDFQLVEIEALELLGDIAVESGDPEIAVKQYRAALAVLKRLSWDSKETDISIKLAEIHVERGSLESAEPLVGLISQRPETLAGLRLRAHYAAGKGDFSVAADLMQRARNLDDGRWTEVDERELAIYLVEAG